MFLTHSHQTPKQIRKNIKWETILRTWIGTRISIVMTAYWAHAVKTRLTRLVVSNTGMAIPTQEGRAPGTGRRIFAIAIAMAWRYWPYRYSSTYSSTRVLAPCIHSVCTTHVSCFYCVTMHGVAINGYWQDWNHQHIATNSAWLWNERSDMRFYTIPLLIYESISSTCVWWAWIGCCRYLCKVFIFTLSGSCIEAQATVSCSPCMHASIFCVGFWAFGCVQRNAAVVLSWQHTHQHESQNLVTTP